MAVKAMERSSSSRPNRLITVDRLAGAGGLFFVGTIVVQNIVRSGAPGFGASPATVAGYFAHHRAAVLTPLGLFPIGMLALFAFTAGVWSWGHRADAPWWGGMGALGVAAIAALFALVNIGEIVLAAKDTQLAASPGVVEALWAFHAAAFGLVLAAQAVALVGLSRAALAAGLIPGWLDVPTLAGAGCLLVSSVFTVAIVNGGPWIALGLVGFFVWGVFIAVAGISLVRRSF
jgi:hypothetical protein